MAQKLDREILLPRRPNDGDRKEIKRIDIRLRRKEECRDTHLGGGYFKEFGDETHQHQDQIPKLIRTQSTYKKPHMTPNLRSHHRQKNPLPGSYPAIPVQEYGDGPIEEIAVRYVRINRFIEDRAPRNRQQEDNIRAVELDFMLDL